MLVLFAACDNDFESEFDLAPDERTEIVLNEWQDALTSSEHGWITHYYPNPEFLGGFTYVLKFDENGSVVMNWEIGDTPDESLYSLKMFEKPVLVFDTYSIFSKMTDPSIGKPGQGFGGELEFAFVKKSVAGDSIYLEERVSGDPLVLVKAEAVAWENIKKYSDMAALMERRNEKVVPFYLNLFVEGWDTKVNLVYNEDMQKTRLTYTENGEAKAIDMPINFTHEGFEFHHALEFNGIKVRSFKYDEAKNEYVVLDNGVTGAFKYDTECHSVFDGAYEIFFGGNKFGGYSQYASPKMMEAFKDLNPNAGFGGIGYTPYYSGTWSIRSAVINFDDWTDIGIKISEFEKIDENTVVWHFGSYKTSGWGVDYTEEEINAMMDSEAGQKLYNILFSEKGWTIVPVFLAEYGSTNYLVSNEDPEMYMFYD